jgi:hypothetical protein
VDWTAVVGGAASTAIGTQVAYPIVRFTRNGEVVKYLRDASRASAGAQSLAGGCVLAGAALIVADSALKHGPELQSDPAHAVTGFTIDVGLNLFAGVEHYFLGNWV